MSDPRKPEQDNGESDNPNTGPSLTLIYSLIALAIVVAIGVAFMIVLPFYQRAH